MIVSNIQRKVVIKKNKKGNTIMRNKQKCYFVVHWKPNESINFSLCLANMDITPGLALAD